MSDNQFAAQLDKVVRDPSGYEVYSDADRFFDLTYPTSGLKQLLAKTFGRLAGVAGDDGDHGVLRAETSFGGGKTHSLVAVYHLAKGARPANVNDFLDTSLLPEGPVSVAAVVGDALDPVNGLATNGLTSRTLWGEVGAQLGPAAHQALAQSDLERTAPGTETLRKALAGRPTVIIIDEIAQHLRQVAESGNESVRRSAAQVPVFLKNLFELAMGDPGVVVIISLASSGDAYAKETSELGQLLDGATRAATAHAESASVLSRSGRVIQPATDSEIAEILKRRLFESIDPAAAKEAGEAYRGLYEQIGETVALAGGAESPARYGDAVAASYPFHPETIRVLDKRLGSIPNFQRARGSLKLLAEVVADLWEGTANPEIINVADINLARLNTLNHLTIAIDRAAFSGVAKVDLAGLESHCHAVDVARFPGKPPFATRAATTVFLHSLEMRAGVGAGRSEYVLGTLRVGEAPEILDEALAEAEGVCWHLTYDGTRWRFHTEPNVNKIVEDGKRDIPSTRVTEETKALIAKSFTSDAGVTAVVFPTSPASVSDEPRLRVVAFDYDHISVEGTASATAPPQVVEMRDRAGAAGSLRAYRNAVVFVVADTGAVEDLKDRVRSQLALEALVTEPARLATFAKEVKTKVREMYDDSGLNARIAVTRCYKHVYYPVKDASSNHLAHRELPAAQKGDTAKSVVRTVRELLVNEGKVRTEPIPTNWLRQRAWDKPESTTTKKISDWFWRDQSALLLLDPTLLTDAIKKGIANDGWVYYDTLTEKAYSATSATPAIQLVDTAELYTAEEAAARGILGRAPSLGDVLASVSPATTGPALRAALEMRCQKEPTKTQVADQLAEAFRQGKLVVTDVTPAAGVKALGVKEIRERSLDNFHVLTKAEADKLGVESAVAKPASKRIDAKTGQAGVALSNFRDALMDKGKPLVEMRLTVRAEAGTGLQDFDLLGMALAQMPKQPARVTVDVAASLPGLDGAVDIRLEGDKARYQQVSAKLGPLLNAANEVDGMLTLTLDFGENGVTPTDEAFGTVDAVIRGLGPSELTVEGTVA
ncbi:ATP-binding protein [Micromonospora chalcea]|uniref:ATP-binding protein n=1 Tax=Micromonospora chalcea TaxID=1874 RepID=UPI003CF639C6